MNANSFIATFQQTQDALLVLNFLHMFGSGWPPGALVKNESTYDYIVVGGGTAGCVVASRLAEDKTLRILLIESGGDPPIESTLNGLSSTLYYSRYAHYYETKPDPNVFQCHRGKKYVIQTGKMLGGASSFNAGGFERGTIEDYDSIAKAANDSAWTFESLLPYFKKSESLKDFAVKNSSYAQYHGFNGPTVVTRDTRPQTEGYLKSLKELGNNILIDLTGHTTVGYIQPLMSTSKEGRSSSARAYLSSPIENLDILKKTDVSQIIFDENKNAVGVKAGNLTLYARQEVIMAAGIFATTKILLLSGIGPRKDLESYNITVISDLPVGENFQDAAAVLLFHKLRKTKKLQPPADIFQFPDPYIIGFASTNKSSSTPEYTTVGYVVSNYKDVYGFCILRSFEHSICDKLLSEINSGKYDILVTYIWKAKPRSRGKISLRKPCINDPPVIDTGIYRDERDLDDCVEYIKDYIKIENTTYFKEQDGQFIDPMTGSCCKDKYRSDDYWRCLCRCLMLPITHNVGANAIGTVVDSRLNVKGVQRLRIADASIIPNAITGGTGSSTLVVGEKAADMIKEDHICDVNYR